MRTRVWLSLLVMASPCVAWDTVPHQRITKAALDSLPARFLCRLGDHSQPLIEIYSLYPDLYLEMDRYGFVRKNSGPRTAAEIMRFCVHPDGREIHGATGNRKSDRASLVYLLEQITAALAGNRSGEAAQYAGVLSHFIADSLSPPHAVTPEDLEDLSPLPNLHAAIEHSVPAFTLTGRAPRLIAPHLAGLASAVLEECYAGAGQNRKDLPQIVKAVAAHDEETLNRYRLHAARKAAESLADALYTAFHLEKP